jgi:hypothetical protein
MGNIRIQGFSKIVDEDTVLVTSDPFVVGENHPVTLVAKGLAAGETVDLQISYDGVDYEDCWAENTQLQLSTTNNPVTVYGPGMFRVVKNVTAGAAGVAKWEKP